MGDQVESVQYWPPVELRNVSVVHGSGPQAVVALRHLNMTLREKEFVCLIGPSGCGKSTLLKAVADLLPKRAVQGQICIGGRTPDEARRDNSFAFVFQDPVLAPWRTALQNVRLPLEVVRAPRTETTTTRGTPTRSPEELLKLVGLQGFENARPAELSGGMRQRVSIARALTLEPSVLLMDEPFGSLDEMTRDHMQDELMGVWDSTGATVLLVTHSISEAVFLGDRVFVMTARPGHFKSVVDVTFPRPRSAALKTTVAFLDKINEVRALLGGQP